MGHIAIKDHILARVTELARSRGIPVEQQTEALLLQAMGTTGSAQAIRGHLEAIARLTPPDAVQTDSATLIREDRDR